MLIYFTTGSDQVEETVGGLIMISTLFYYYKNAARSLTCSITLLENTMEK